MPASSVFELCLLTQGRTKESCSAEKFGIEIQIYLAIADKKSLPSIVRLRAHKRETPPSSTDTPMMVRNDKAGGGRCQEFSKEAEQLRLKHKKTAG
jgi:hypothetical protein